MVYAGVQFVDIDPQDQEQLMRYIILSLQRQPPAR
jgi:c-di-GMP-binding flagellar brake protein YcgR